MRLLQSKGYDFYQEVHLDKMVKLLDCPGIVFSTGTNENDAILRNAVKIEQLEDPITPGMLVYSYQGL